MPLVVNVPVCDLREEPKDLPRDFSYNKLRQSQLIFGEELRLIEERGDFLLVEAKEELRFTKEKGWHYYPGYVHRTEVAFCPTLPLPQFVKVSRDLDFGVKTDEMVGACRPLNAPFSREQLIQDALLFLGLPYLWGGKAFFSQNPAASVDCSGLIYLLFRAQGITVPRDAHDQFLLSEKIHRDELRPGDLLFWAPESTPERITHVVLYVNPQTFLEAPMSGKKVCLSPLPKEFWNNGPYEYFSGREKVYKVFTGRFSKKTKLPI